MIKVEWSIFKNFVDERKLSIQWLELSNKYILKAFDGNFDLECELSKTPTDTSDLDDFINNYKNKGNVKLDPRTEDNRPMVAENRVPGGYSLYVTGVSDNLNAASYGTGDDLKFNKDNNTREFQLLSHYYAIGARAIWESADHHNYFNATLIAPATSGLINQPGDFNKVEISPSSGLNKIVPVETGTGFWDLDITAKHNGTEVLKCVPVPSAGNKGHFDYDSSNNILTVNSQGTGGYDLYDFDVNLHAFGRKIWGSALPGVSSDLDVTGLVGKLIYNTWKIKLDFNLDGGVLQVDDEASVVFIVATKKNII